MFGLKIISKRKYESLVDSSSKEKEYINRTKEMDNTIGELKAKVEAQEKIIEKASFINSHRANENGCKVGPWCAKCQFSEEMKESVLYRFNEKNFNDYYMRLDYASVDAGYYCTRHLKDICPEFKNNKN